MTANQINYKVGTDTVSETKRHNVASEKIQQQLADLEDSKLMFQDQWKTRDQFIQQDYNNKYIEYLNQGLNETIAHDRATEDIAQDKNDNDAYYQTVLGEVQREINNLTRARDSETARHNKMVEEWNDMGNWLKSKDLEYQQSATLLQASKDEAQLAFQKYKANLDAELQQSKVLMEAQIAKTQMELDKYKTDTQLEMSKRQMVTGLGGTIISSILHFAGRR